MEKNFTQGFLRNFLWLICLLVGGCGFVYVFYFMSRAPQMTSVWEYFFRVLVFLPLVASIAFFPNTSKKGYLLLIAAIIFYASFIAHKMDYIGYKQLLVGVTSAADDYYTMLYLILFPFVISCISFSYRIGGGSSGNCLKIAFSGIVILFSGLVEVVYEIANPVIIPEVIPFNFYYKAIWSHFPTYKEEVIFCLCHIPIVAGLLLLPLDQWIHKIFSPSPQAAPITASRH